MGFVACLLGYLGAVASLLIGFAMMACALFTPVSEPGPDVLAAMARKAPSLAQPAVEKRHMGATKITDGDRRRRGAHVAAASARQGSNKGSNGVARHDRSRQLASTPAPVPAPDTEGRHLSYAQDLSRRFGETW
jgi:hypothetical protein